MTRKSTLIIAEAGVNHNGDMELARRLIDAAAEAGADIVKFQTFRAQSLTTSQANMADYQTQNTGTRQSQQSMLEKLQLSPAMHRELVKHCESRRIAFLSTGFDIESIDFLCSLGIRLFKIPSGEITNLPYLRHIGKLGESVILSTGMASIGEVEQAIAVLEESGTNREKVTVLHCTTEYPAPFSEVNLRAMIRMGECFGVKVGYSDHTLGIEIPIAAAALGAQVIEKHFTLDRTLPGPDHKASLEPDELRSMVRAIRNVEAALGDGIKRPTASERKNMAVARKSIVAAVAIEKGERFSSTNLTTKRPGTGISPMRWDDLIGRVAPRSFAADELIEW
jgi:N,N'-diacetyllegionaminate synthase